MPKSLDAKVPGIELLTGKLNRCRMILSTKADNYDVHLIGFEIIASREYLYENPEITSLPIATKIIIRPKKRSDYFGNSATIYFCLTIDGAKIICSISCPIGILV